MITIIKNNNLHLYGLKKIKIITNNDVIDYSKRLIMSKNPFKLKLMTSSHQLPY